MLASLSSRLLDVRVEYQRGAEEEEDSTIVSFFSILGVGNLL